MFWGSRTSSYNVVTFWLKLASTFYALFLFILLYHGFMVRQPCCFFLIFCFSPHAFEGFCFYNCLLYFNLSCHDINRHHFSTSFRSGRSGASMLRPALVGPRYFHLIFIDQALPSAELRTIIFSFLYIPPLDCWPFERPLHGPWNYDLYHFSVICTAVYHPCVSFLSVDTPSVALSPASSLFS
jgi:hypothetical protein